MGRNRLIGRVRPITGPRATGTMRLSKPPIQIRMEQKRTGNRTFDRASAGCTGKPVVHSSGDVFGARKGAKSTHSIRGTRSCPVIGGVFPGEGRSVAGGDSRQQQATVPESQPQDIPQFGISPPCALHDRGNA